MRLKFSHISLSLLLIVALLVASAPARLLPWIMPGEQVILQGLSGTVWRGQASRSLWQMNSDSYAHLGQLQWRLRPWSLLLFAPTVEFESQWGDQYLAAEVTAHGAEDFEIKALEANINAALLKHWVPVALSGRLSLQLSKLRLQQGWPVEADGRLVWQYASWSAPQGALPLGSYVLAFEQPTSAAPLEAKVLTLSGTVRAEGTAQLDRQGYRLDLKIQGEGGLDPSLEQALSLVAKPEGESLVLQLSGAIPHFK